MNGNKGTIYSRFERIKRILNSCVEERRTPTDDECCLIGSLFYLIWMAKDEFRFDNPKLALTKFYLSFIPFEDGRS